jgi:hypothetical protein
MLITKLMSDRLHKFTDFSPEIAGSWSAHRTSKKKFLTGRLKVLVNAAEFYEQESISDWWRWLYWVSYG